MSDFSMGLVKAPLSLASKVRAERQLQKASPSQNVISKRSFYHMIYLYCFSMVQSFLIHMQNPEREEKKRNRKKTLRPKSQEPCWGQGNGLVVFEGCLKPSKWYGLLCINQIKTGSLIMIRLIFPMPSEASLVRNIIRGRPCFYSRQEQSR